MPVDVLSYFWNRTADKTIRDIQETQVYTPVPENSENFSESIILRYFATATNYKIIANIHAP